MIGYRILFLPLLIVPFASSLQVVLDSSGDGRFHIVHNVNGTERTLFHGGGEFAAFVGGRWCRQHEHPPTSSSAPNRSAREEPPAIREMRGHDETLGPYTALVQEITCHTSQDVIRIMATIQNFDSKAHVVFQLSWPDGAWGTSTIDDPDVSDGEGAWASSMAPWPVIRSTTLSSTISWQGTFMNPTIRHGGPSSSSSSQQGGGANGGPIVFYNDSDVSFSTVIVASAWNGNWKAFSSGNGSDYKGEKVVWAPGTSGRIQRLDKGYTQSVLFYAGSGITHTIYEWGQTLQQSRPSKGRKIADLTLQKIGYQTDNGAYYCFCKEQNCSKTLIDEISHLKSLGVPMGYLSFQGAGSSSGRGSAAPWCVERWGVDGGLSKNYPVAVKDLQRAIDIPLQLYAPYFCPESPYFQTSSKWKSVTSNTSFPSCGMFDFLDVTPIQSRAFYNELFDRGVAAGMVSYESDFMNQNFNCIPDFVQSTNAAPMWQLGMANAAMARNLSIQWCMATPSDVLASVDLPSVTNFRVSTDFCYGNSWEIGLSSLLVWALGAAPSKDTLWTTNNKRTAIPGCPWTPDHETPAAELHLVLSLMSTGPVGISDGIGMTNATLLKRAITKDGTLLKPSKPITAVDSSFLETSISRINGYIYGTVGYHNHSWHFVSFKMKRPSPVRMRDFWPPIASPVNGDFTVLAYRSFHESAPCLHGSDATSSGCARLLVLSKESDSSTSIFDAPKSSFKNVTGGSDYAPSVTTMWQGCFPKSNVILLGELDKYVPLSPARFARISCTTKGVEAEIKGIPREVVALTALQIMISPTDHLLAFKSGVKVILRNVTVPQCGHITVSFNEQVHEGADVWKLVETEAV